MAARTNSSIISDQAKALSAGITTQRDGLTRINNALDNATISTVDGALIGAMVGLPQLISTSQLSVTPL